MHKFRENFWTIVFVILLFIFFIIVIFMINMTTKQTPKEERVGAIFIDTIEDNGWNEDHYTGLNKACQDMDLSLNIVQYVNESHEAAESAISELVQKGCTVIFLTSDGFGDNIKDILESYPDIKFYTISTESSATNSTTYFGRMYQMRYLTGIVAGEMTKSNILGFVAATSTPQVDRGINAYLLGARSVNPDAVVKVYFTNSWRDDEAEREAARVLIEDVGADVITYHASLSNSIDVAEELGVYSIGFNSVQKERSENFLTAAVFNWYPLYYDILTDYMKSDYNDNKYYWYGSYFNAVELTELSDEVPEYVDNLIEQANKRFMGVEDVFMNEIYRNDGTLACHDGERISDNALLRNMDWFVEGVEIYEQ